MGKQTKITKDKVMVFLDTSKTRNSESWLPAWNRIDKSTVFDLAFNPESEEVDYIDMPAPTQEISGYKPSLPQEIGCYRGNPIYELVEYMMIHLPVGDDTRVPALVVWPPREDGSMEAWQCKDSVLLINNFQPVDGKATFTVDLGGNKDVGTATVGEDGKPVFVKGE